MHPCYSTLICIFEEAQLPFNMSRISTGIFFCLLFLPVFLHAQLINYSSYPKGYFKWPVEAKPALVANFGELRPNHYHMGLDCRTDQKENVPILAAADGYIAKVKIEPFGFGRAIYINHPNGLTTLYAHLNKFTPELEKYITEQQYKLKQWKIFIDIPEYLFPVNQGDFIAYSGNTGGSQGPHLHFEIRDTETDKVLNPLLFGFPIEDNIPPDILRLAVYDRRISTYEQTPAVYPLKKINGVYVPAGGTINVKSDKVSFAITSFDRYTGSTNQNGIYGAVLMENSKLLIRFEMDSISYDETRYLNAHIDYKTKSSGGSYLQHLSTLPGHANGIYHSSGEEDGIISLADVASKTITIKVYDANNNISTLQFNIHKTEPMSDVSETSGILFKPGHVNIFENNSLSFYLPENSIYDAFHFQYREMTTPDGRPIYQLHNTSVPVQQYFPIKIKDDFPIKDTGRIVMKRFFNAKDDFKKAIYDQGWYKASFREFGNVQLILDTEPPTVTPLWGFRDGIHLSGKNRIAFAVTDNTEEIDSFTALLDGKWLRFSNDKAKTFIYDVDEYCGFGEHNLTIIVKDLVGNTTTKTYHFTR